LVFVFIGYASMATLSIGFFAILIFLYRAVIGVSPYVYVLYGLFSEIFLIWALRPNLKSLREGTERVVGLRAYQIKKADKGLHFNRE
jgi:glycerol-3-phosphate acyltransferase PlsY